MLEGASASAIRKSVYDVKMTEIPLSYCLLQPVPLPLMASAKPPLSPTPPPLRSFLQADALESYVGSSRYLKRYEATTVGKLKYLAIVVDSEDARQIAKVIKLVHWLADIGIKHVCLYDTEGVLKKYKEIILEKFKCVKLSGEGVEDTLREHQIMSLDFVSQSDEKVVADQNQSCS